MANDRFRFQGATVGADQWTALLVAIAGVLAGLAAIPETSYRTFVLVGAGVLVLLALVIAVRSSRAAQPAFVIETPTPDQRFSPGAVLISGTTPDLHSDTLWVFEEVLVEGRRAWLFGGEALVNGTRWSFDYELKRGPNHKWRRTLSVVRADRNCERQLRSIKSDGSGQRVVYDPTPGGCEVLGQISMIL